MKLAITDMRNALEARIHDDVLKGYNRYQNLKQTLQELSRTARQG